MGTAASQSPAESNPLSTGDIIVAKAKEVAALAAGKAYKWGGRTTDGFDCSGFVTYVLAQVVPWKAEILINLGTSGIVSSDLFEKVTSPSPGDIIYFDKESGVDHVGFVLDDKEWIGSQSSTGVARVKFTNVWWNTNRPTRMYFRLKTLTTAAAARVGRRWIA